MKKSGPVLYVDIPRRPLQPLIPPRRLSWRKWMQTLRAKLEKKG